MKSLKLILAVTLSALAAVVVPSPASADWTVKGRGFGHGVGMSQYGAFGLAKEGRSYKGILRHYYTGVTIGNAEARSVRVLLAPGVGSMTLSGARRACGATLNGRKSYSFRLSGGSVTLHRPNGSKLRGCGKEGAAGGGGSVVYSGVGEYRGKLVARNVNGSLYAINKVGVEPYVQGVVPYEVPTSWPAAALRAQAVAARSYALGTRLNGDGYDLYDDNRSQVYNGKAGEVKSTNRAVKATSREVIEHDGSLAVAYFFSTSGGQTENSEFGFSGGSPRPYLKAVNDPFDDASPVHKWRVRFTNSEMGSRLAGLYSGSFRDVNVLKRGESPRVVRARVVGSNGSTEVSGDTLRFRLGLRSTWAYFKKR